MITRQDTELLELEGQQVEIILTEESAGNWVVGVNIFGKRAGTTQIAFADKSEARNYAMAVARAELAKRHRP